MRGLTKMKCANSECNNQADDDSSYCGEHQRSPFSVPRYIENNSSVDEDFTSGHSDKDGLLDGATGSDESDESQDYA